MVWLGNVSFAFYLWHRLVLIYGHRMLGVGRTWGSAEVLGLSVAGFAVALLLAWLTFEYVEKPAMRRWSRPRSAPASTEPVLTTATP
jgi:peptidoglycan/LPS O-acetylase OafA/YrhL